MAAVGAGNRILRLQRGSHAHGHRLLADAGVGCAADAPLMKQPLDRFLEEADRQHARMAGEKVHDRGNIRGLRGGWEGQVLLAFSDRSINPHDHCHRIA